MKNLQSISNIKRITILILMSIFLSSVNLDLFAQKCKPDILTVDKISKKKFTAWTGELYETSSGAVIVGSTTSTLQVTLIIGSEQDANFIQLLVKKSESSKQSAAAEAPLKGSKGNEFMLGFKDGEPLNFSATAVQNNSKIAMGGLVTMISYGAYIPNEQLPSTIESLTTKTIDAFRIKFDNDVVIEKSVKEKNGEKMKNKASCFESFLKENGQLK